MFYKTTFRCLMGVGFPLLLRCSAMGQSVTALEPAFVVSRLSEIEHLYLGIANTVHMAVEGVPCNALRVSSSQGRVEGEGCTYTIVPDDPSRLLFLTAKWHEGEEERSVTRSFSVWRLPPPQPFFAGRTCADDSILIMEARAGRGVLAKYGFYEEPARTQNGIRFRVESFDLELGRDRTTIFFEHGSSSALTETMRTALEQAQVGDHLRIFNILVTSEQGGEMPLPPIRLSLRE